MSNPFDGGKVKFGFSKIITKPNLIKNDAGNISKTAKIEKIESIEGKSIKIIGKNADEEINKKLVIPMTNDQRSTPLQKLISDRRLKRSQIKNEEMVVEVKQEKIDESLDQQAARELMEDLQNKAVVNSTKVFEVPMNPDELPLNGAKESSLDDYDRVPIGDFGKAMLRGMGWKEEENKDATDKFLEGPVLRPKGMGLGADSAIKKQPLLIPPSHSETLEIRKRACVKVLAGKHKNLYGTIEGFDDGGGRVIVKLAIGGLKATLNEFMVQPVSKLEYEKYSKVLNHVKPNADQVEKPGKYERDQLSKRDFGLNKSHQKTQERREHRDRSESSSDRKQEKDRSHSRHHKSRHSNNSDEHRLSRKRRNYRDSSSSDNRETKSRDKKHKKKSKSKHDRDRS